MPTVAAIVWLYRGEADRFLALVTQYLAQTLAEAARCFTLTLEDGTVVSRLKRYTSALLAIQATVQPFMESLDDGAADTEVFTELRDAIITLDGDIAAFHQAVTFEQTTWAKDELVALAESALSLESQSQLQDLLSRQAEEELLGDDLATLDQLLARVDDLNLLKAKARYTLEYQRYLHPLSQ